jgi:hypothetical protein
MVNAFRPLVLIFALAGQAVLPFQPVLGQEPAPDVLVLDFEAPPVSVAASADGTVQLAVAGLETTQAPGQLALPFESRLIAVPAGSTASLELVSSETQMQPLNAPITRAPVPEGWRVDASGEVIGGALIPVSASPAFDATDAPELAAANSGPLEPVVLEPVGVMRGVQLARVVFYPARPQNATTLAVTRRAQVRVRFTASSPDARASDDLGLIRHQVVNPEAIQIAPLSVGVEAPAAGGPRILIEVDAPGLTALRPEALRAAGFPVDGNDPARLRLTQGGSDVLMQFEGNGNTAFEAGERLLFYADPRFSRYTTRDVYELSLAAGPVARMTSRPAVTGATGATPIRSQTFEVNQLYMPQCSCGQLPAGRDSDRWAWQSLSYPTKASISLPFATPDVISTQGATLTVWLVGTTRLAAINPDHRVSLAVNGTGVGTFEWDGQAAVTQTVTVPAGVLTGANTLTVSLPGISGAQVESAYFDAFRVDYATSGGSGAFAGVPGQASYALTLSNANGGVWALDISSATQPVVLTGLSGTAVTIGDATSSPTPRRYWLSTEAEVRTPVALRAPLGANGAAADYVLISHADFLPALQPLIATRQAQGLTVVVENVQALYDTFGDGRPSPDAIRAYIANSYSTYNRRLKYVVLVGDGTFDPKRYVSTGQPTFIPPYLATVDPWLGETAADNRFVTVEGDDALPDVAIGRLPVNTLAQAQTVAAKLSGYAGTIGFWTGSALFVADDRDGGGDFPATAERMIANDLGGGLQVGRIYHAPGGVITTTRTAITHTLNSGMGLVVYNGHSSQRQWAGERLFHMDDANALTNAGRYPVMVQLTCFTGSFHDSALSTLDESLLLRANGGAIGVWGATGLGIATGHDSLAQGFLTRIYRDRQPDVGTALLAGKLSLAGTGQYLDLLDTFTWLGDPATQAAVRPPSNLLHLPLIRR